MSETMSFRLHNGAFAFDKRPRCIYAAAAASIVGDASPALPQRAHQGLTSSASYRRRKIAATGSEETFRIVNTRDTP